MKHSELRHQPRHVNPRIQDNMLPFVHSELPFMHRGIEKYKDFVIFKVYYYILSILRIYNMEWR